MIETCPFGMLMSNCDAFMMTWCPCVCGYVCVCVYMHVWAGMRVCACVYICIVYVHVCGLYAHIREGICVHRGESRMSYVCSDALHSPIILGISLNLELC